MRGTLFSLQNLFPQQKLPLPLFKLFTYGLLQALDYLHNECRLIHTGKSAPSAPHIHVSFYNGPVDRVLLSRFQDFT
jgi:hypothetical protein